MSGSLALPCLPLIPAPLAPSLTSSQPNVAVPARSCAGQPLSVVVQAVTGEQEPPEVAIKLARRFPAKSAAEGQCLRRDKCTPLLCGRV